MDFIDFEAMEDGCNKDLIFSDDENKDSCKVNDTFIDDSKQKENEPNFYRSIDQKRDLNELTSYKNLLIKQETLGKLFMMKRMMRLLLIRETYNLSYMQIKAEKVLFLMTF